MIAHDQARFPLATLLLVARERARIAHVVRLLSLAACVSAQRAERGIPTIDE